MWTSPPSPTKHIVPHTFVERIAFSRASGLLEVSQRQIREAAMGEILDRGDGSFEPG